MLLFHKHVIFVEKNKPIHAFRKPFELKVYLFFVVFFARASRTSLDFSLPCPKLKIERITETVVEVS